MAEDVHIARKYGLDNFISARRECKAALQKKLGLVITPNAVPETQTAGKLGGCLLLASLRHIALARSEHL